MIRRWLRRAIFIANGRTVRINGRRIKIPGKFLSHFNVRQNNVVEPEVDSMLSRLIKPGTFFVDVGANIGIFSLLASDLSGRDGRVFAFEPNPITFGFLSELIALNKRFDNLVMLQLAASDKCGASSLRLNQCGSELMERSSFILKEAGSHDVTVLTNQLDRILPGELKVDMMKIDVEGAELSVLKGCEKTIASQRPIVCVEVHGLFYSEPAKHVQGVFSFFEQLGYSAINLEKACDETAAGFISDTGASGKDLSTGTFLSRMGYGNLIFVADSTQRDAVMNSFVPTTMIAK